MSDAAADSECTCDRSKVSYVGPYCDECGGRLKMNQQDYKTVSALKKQVDALTVALRETEQLLAASRGMFKAADEEIKRLREQMESDACRRSAENASRDMNDSLRE